MDEFYSSRYLTEKVIEETVRHGPVRYRPSHLTLDETPAVEREELPASLTSREAEVLRLVAQGLSNSEVARSLTISPHTVHAHLHTIYSKLGVTCRTAAARFAFEIGLF
jgi:DNA-binding NarL/FixJ family response regulator